MNRNEMSTDSRLQALEAQVDNLVKFLEDLLAPTVSENTTEGEVV
jgi:hypothetical protein